VPCCTSHCWYLLCYYHCCWRWVLVYIYCCLERSLLFVVGCCYGWHLLLVPDVDLLCFVVWFPLGELCWFKVFWPGCCCYCWVVRWFVLDSGLVYVVGVLLFRFLLWRVVIRCCCELLCSCCLVVSCCIVSLFVERVVLLLLFCFVTLLRVVVVVGGTFIVILLLFICWHYVVWTDILWCLVGVDSLIYCWLSWYYDSCCSVLLLLLLILVTKPCSLDLPLFPCYCCCCCCIYATLCSDLETFVYRFCLFCTYLRHYVDVVVVTVELLEPRGTCCCSISLWLLLVLSVTWFVGYVVVPVTDFHCYRLRCSVVLVWTLLRFVVCCICWTDVVVVWFLLRCCCYV